MRNLARNSLIVFAVTITTIYLTDSILGGLWNFVALYLEIGALSVIICLIKILIDKFQSQYYLLNIIIQFAITLVLVLLFGYAFGWYHPEDIWIMCVVVAVAYIVCYFLGVLKTKRDVALINEKLQKKHRMKQQEGMEK